MSDIMIIMYLYISRFVTLAIETIDEVLKKIKRPRSKIVKPPLGRDPIA